MIRKRFQNGFTFHQTKHTFHDTHEVEFVRSILRMEAACLSWICVENFCARLLTQGMHLRAKKLFVAGARTTCFSKGPRLLNTRTAPGHSCTRGPVYGAARMDEEPPGAHLLSESASSSPSSESLLSRHLFSVQNQVRALQQEVQDLKASEAFGEDRLAAGDSEPERLSARHLCAHCAD